MALADTLKDRRIMKVQRLTPASLFLQSKRLYFRTKSEECNETDFLNSPIEMSCITFTKIIIYMIFVKTGSVKTTFSGFVLLPAATLLRNFCISSAADPKMAALNEFGVVDTIADEDDVPDLDDEEESEEGVIRII